MKILTYLTLAGLLLSCTPETLSIFDGAERVEVGEGTFETEIDIPVSDI